MAMYVREVRCFPKDLLKLDRWRSLIGKVGKNPFSMIDDRWLQLADVRVYDVFRDSALVEPSARVAEGYVPVEFTFKRFRVVVGFTSIDFAEEIKGGEV
jgi:hypothetical protein